VDALVDELDDEHAVATPSSNAAAAPAAGTDKDRFILAPSRELSSSAVGTRMAQGTPRKRAGAWPAYIPSADLFSCRQPRRNI
jgi:hypothetical protein